MKKILISFLLGLSICKIHAQNDTMYVYKNGTAISKLNVAVVDSIEYTGLYHVENVPMEW